MAALAIFFGFRLGGHTAGGDPNAGFLSNNNIWSDTDFWDDTRITG